MKSVEFNRKSWHYRLATVYANYKEVDNWGNINRGELNICAYSQSVFAGFLIVCLITAAGSLVGAMFADFFAWLFVMYSFGGFIEPGTLAVGVIVVVLLFSAVALYVWLSEIKPIGKVIDKIDNSFIGSAYEAFKDKVCFQVKFKE